MALRDEKRLPRWRGKGQTACPVCAGKKGREKRELMNENEHRVNMTMFIWERQLPKPFITKSYSRWLTLPSTALTHPEE